MIAIIVISSIAVGFGLAMLTGQLRGPGDPPKVRLGTVLNVDGHEVMVREIGASYGTFTDMHMHLGLSNVDLTVKRPR